MLNEKQLAYLKQSVGFHFEDLSSSTQLAFKARTEPFEWKLAALSEGTLKDWNDHGFRLWNNADFKARVQNKLEVISKMTDEEISPTPQESSSFKKKEKTLSFFDLASYPKEVWKWCDDDLHVKSKITGKCFLVPCGRAEYEKMLKGEGLLQVLPGCRYKYNKKAGRWDIAY